MEDEGGRSSVEFNNSQMLQLLRESLLPNHYIRDPFRSHSGLSKPKAHVTLDGFEDGEDGPGYVRQTRRRSRPRPFVKDHRAGAGITNVIVCADECVYQLQQVANRLGTIASRNEQLAKGEKISDRVKDFTQLAELAKHIMMISRQSFVPAHRLCQSAIGLYMTEDFIREPRDVECVDYFSQGPIRVPGQDSQQKTLERLQVCVDKAEESCTRFQPIIFTCDRQNVANQRKIEYEEMRDILLIMKSSILNLYSTTNGCFHLFKLLLYINPEQQVTLTGFLNSLNSMEKSDLLEDISTLRRSVDHIPLLLEKLSWASCTVFRLASGKSVSPSPVESETNTPHNDAFSQSKQTLDALVNRKMLQKVAGTESAYSRSIDGKDRRLKEKEALRSETASEREISGSHRSRSKSTKPSKTVVSLSSKQSMSKVKSKSKEALNVRQRQKSISKEKKAKNKAKKQALKKMKNVPETESQDDVDEDDS